MPVRFSYAFRIPLYRFGAPQHSAARSIWRPRTGILAPRCRPSPAWSRSRPGAVSKAGGQIVDSATNTVAIALSANTSGPHHARPGSLGGPGWLDEHRAENRCAHRERGHVATAPARAARAPTKSSAAPLFDPLHPPSVAAGNDCYPDDISDADAATASAQQLVCQLTSATETETIMSSFQNAQAGDVILSPAPVGAGDLIAAMFSALSPPQHWGHSGIMTANFFEITHCTACG